MALKTLTKREPTGTGYIGVGVPALWARKSRGPFRRKQVIQTGLFSGELLLKLLKSVMENSIRVGYEW
jgi:hypothetical protein